MELFFFIREDVKVGDLVTEYKNGESRIGETRASFDHFKKQIEKRCRRLSATVADCRRQCKMFDFQSIQKISSELKKRNFTVIAVDFLVAWY